MYRDRDREFLSFTEKASMSLIHALCWSTESLEIPTTFTFRFSNSGTYLATLPNSVVHTGVKSAATISFKRFLFYITTIFTYSSIHF